MALQEAHETATSAPHLKQEACFCSPTYRVLARALGHHAECGLGQHGWTLALLQHEHLIPAMVSLVWEVPKAQAYAACATLTLAISASIGIRDDAVQHGILRAVAASSNICQPTDDALGAELVADLLLAVLQRYEVVNPPTPFEPVPLHQVSASLTTQTI